MGYRHACAIGSDDKAYCWGDNAELELGNGSNIDSPVAVEVSASDGSGSGLLATIISAGGHATCAVKSTDNKAYCWGDNAKGQLGDNSTTTRNKPTAVLTSGSSALTMDVTSIHAGDYHSCALGNDKKIYCWGWNKDGEVGNNSTAQVNYPVAITPHASA